MDQERVIYRQPAASGIDFPTLGKAVGGLKFGTVAFDKLRDPDSATSFLETLLTEHLGAQPMAPDAIVIISPKVMLDKNPVRDQMAEAGWVDCPVFYLNYNADPIGNPWRDAIGTVLKAYRGVEYSISAPKDLGKAVGGMMSLLKTNR